MSVFLISHGESYQRNNYHDGDDCKLKSRKSRRSSSLRQNNHVRLLSELSFIAQLPVIGPRSQHTRSNSLCPSFFVFTQKKTNSLQFFHCKSGNLLTQDIWPKYFRASYQVSCQFLDKQLLNQLQSRELVTCVPVSCRVCE